MKRLIVASFLSMVSMLAIPACSATPPGQAQMAEDGPPVQPHVPRVLVFPFAPTGSVSAYDWIGRGIQQSLLADLSRSGTAEIVFPATQPTESRVSPLAVGASAGANVVVVGTYQVNNNQVRVTGEVFDVGTARNLGGIKATGPLIDLFNLEDGLNRQVQQVLPRGYIADTNQLGRVTPPPAADTPAIVDMPAPQTDSATAAATQQPLSTAQQPAPPTTVIPETTYNYYNAVPPTITPPDTYAYDDPYFYPDYDGGYYAPYASYGGWPFFGFIGVGGYGPGFYNGYGYRGYGYRGYGYRGGYHGVEHPFSGGFHSGSFAGGGFHGGGFAGGGFHGGFFSGGGFHGGGGGGGGHR